MSTVDEEDAGALTYAFRSRMIGPGSRFRLQGGVLEWDVGARSGRLALNDVVKVRLTYTPGQLASPMYEMRLTGRNGESVRIGSLSRTSVTQVEDHRPAYVRFIRALHGEMAAHAARMTFLGGMPAWRWWLMAGLATFTFAGLLAVLATVALAGQWPVAAVVVILGLLLGWPVGEMLWRNQPVRYDPSALPTRLVPA